MNNPQWPAPTLTEDGAILISPSQLSLMQRCHRQWGFKYLFGREPDFDGVSAAAGKAFHAALQVRNAAPSITPQVEEEMQVALAKGFEGVLVPMDDYRDQRRYQKALEAYNKHHAEEPFKTLAVEMPLTVDIGWLEMPKAFWFRLDPDRVSEEVLPVRMRCIVDRLIRWDNGLVMVADTKTSKEWKSAHQVLWRRAGAPLAYSYAVQRVAKENPGLGLPEVVNGFMLDSVIIRREASTLKRPRKEGKEDHEFHRLLFYHTPEQIEEWRVNALRLVRTVLLEWADGDLGYNETACASYYGRTCPFIDVCEHATWEQRRRVLSFDKFRDRKNEVFDAAEVEAEEDRTE